MKRTHRDWYAELAARCGEDWVGPNQPEWISRLTREFANIRLALDFCASDPAEAPAGLRMFLSFKEFWLIRGYNNEGIRWLRRLTAAAPRESIWRPRGLWCLAFLTLVQGDEPAMRASLTDAEKHARESGDEQALAYISHVWGYANLIGAEYATAIPQFAAAVEYFRANGDISGDMWATFNHGLVVGLAGDLQNGRKIVRGCIEHCTQHGEHFWRSWAWWSLCALEYLSPDGDPDEAREAALAVLRMQLLLEDRVILAFILTIMAGIATRAGDLRKGARLLGAANTVWQAIGTSPNYYVAFHKPVKEGLVTVTTGLGNDEAGKQFLIGAGLDAEDAVAYALGISPGTAVRPDRDSGPLTKRESQIAELVSEGLTNREIALKLGIAQRTAETHVEHILTKLEFTNRAQIAAWIASSH
jgi:non-specific serine/threonine protein kinase